MKICVKCVIEKELIEFPKTGLDRYRNLCKHCYNEYKRNRYDDDEREKMRIRTNKNRPKKKAKLKEYVWTYKENNTCFDCHKTYPHYVMDFDHLDGYEKLNSMARLVNGNYSINTIDAEIEKCQLVCKNCHKDRTYNRILEKQEINKTKTRKGVEYLRNYKHDKDCVDCGISYPYWVMELDHLSEKIECVSIIAWDGGLEAVIKEIAKCELVCSNCHAARTNSK